MKRVLKALTDRTFDLLILGGGITGAGVALDATLRGLRVALIDKGDFASGTSSVSSKLIHGGLRYLEHGQFRLVWEALHERRLLLQNAPHIVQPLRFVLPFYQGARVAPWKWRAGLTVYDSLAGRSNLHRSRPLDRRRLAAAFPILQVAGLLGGAEYFDAQMDDARLCLAVMRTAALQGATVANYVEAVAFQRAGAEITGVRALDRIGGGEFPIRAPQVLNATGPWVDAVCRLAGDTGGPHLQPTKGVHLVLPNLGLSAAFLLLHPVDGRVFFVIPWLSKTLLGTTDTVTEAGPDALTVLPDEEAYLRAGYHHYFARRLTDRDVLGRFAGLRPLLAGRSGAPSARSREFRLIASPSGLLSAVGGKYTTYRHMAEQITDHIMRRLGRRASCRTRQFRLDGAPSEPWPAFAATTVTSLCQQFPVDVKAAQHLVHRYGRHALAVAAYLRHDPQLAKPIVAGELDLQAEFVYQAEHEMAIYPEDHLLRRTRLGLLCPQATELATSLVSEFQRRGRPDRSVSR